MKYYGNIRALYVNGEFYYHNSDFTTDGKTTKVVISKKVKFDPNYLYYIVVVGAVLEMPELGFESCIESVSKNAISDVLFNIFLPEKSDFYPERYEVTNNTYCASGCA